MRIKMQEQNNKTLSYSQQRKVFNKKIKELSEILKNISSYSSNNNIIYNFFETAVQKLSIDTKYYSLSYFYDTYSKIEDFYQTSEIKKLISILASLLAEEEFKTNDTTSKKLFDALLNNPIDCINTPKSELKKKAQISFSAEEIASIKFQVHSIVLKEMLNELQQRVDSPETLYNKMYKGLATKNNEIQDTLNEYQTKADNLVDFIKKQQSKLNFVGLGSAFKTITKEKNAVKNSIEKYLVGFFVALLVIPIIVAIALYCQDQPNYYFCIPATTIELLVLYAFRLFYQQYLFVKSELQQVNLRHSLCAFIESYMEFKKDNKDNTVDLFEQLIFGNIISDEKKVPATVDGLDGIAKIIETLKGK